ncbi:MAG: molybdopterin-dependent oxidoreductase [Acidobacteriota bacterium]|nr:MAG: molybdopterin-dependent oxidoreductase [Acidobacteriota bacterium]
MKLHYSILFYVLLVSQLTTVVGYNQTEYALSVSGEGISAQKLTITDLMKLPRTKVKAAPHNGKETEYEGVMLGEILKISGQKFGESLRGKALATYLLVEAEDGYQAVFAIPELDIAFTNKVVLLAYRQNNAPLDSKAGPLQIIVPDEKRHARWVRQVKSLVIKRSL